jgi:RND family efflux transporter MFP subunit
MRHKTSKFLMPRTSETGKVLFGSGLALAGLLLSTSLVPAQETKQDMGEAAPQEQLRPLVSVVERGSSQENIQFKVFGVAKAHYRQTLVTEVSGRIIELSPRLESGVRLKQGEVLARIEETDYQTNVASAQQNVAEAELNLLQEEQRSAQAQLDWKRARLQGKPSSPLVLREPFLKLEKLKLETAKANLVQAEKNLTNTTIKAPFDAIVVSRSATPQAYVSAGAQLAEIYSTDELEVEVGLSDKQWQQLLLQDGKPVGLDKIKAEVTNGTDLGWRAEVIAIGAEADSQTRQKKLRLKVQPISPQGAVLRPGAFVNVRLIGREVPDILMVPSSALTLKGNVWTVSSKDQLQRHAVTPLFAKQEQVAIPADQLPSWDRSKPLKIVVNPISRYLPGQYVKPTSNSAAGTSPRAIEKAQVAE